MANMISNKEATAFYVGEVGALVSTGAKAGSQKPIKTIEKNTAFGNVAQWGENNDFPELVMEAANKNTVVPSTLDWKARALFSGGIYWGRVTGFDENNDTIFEPSKPDEFLKIYKYLEKIKFGKYLYDAALDFYWFANVFPTVVLSKDRKTIENLDVHRAHECRFEWQDENGAINNVYVDANWRQWKKANEKFTHKIKAIDTRWDTLGDLKRHKSNGEFIAPISHPGVGKKYYQLAPWDSARTGGWLDFSNSIAEFKKQLMANQMSIKYHIEVAKEWWVWKYPDFDSYGKDERKTVMQTEIDNFLDTMRGNQGAGIAIISTFFYDEVAQKEYAGWKVHTLADPLKDGAYIEDSQEASSHLLYALGVDPTLVGTGPGKQMGSGSGSDKRVALNIYMESIEPHRQLILEPLKLISQYNGWGDDLEFRFRKAKVARLDSGQETAKG